MSQAMPFLSNPADSTGASDLQNCRAALVDRMLWVAFAAALVPSLMVLVAALRSGDVLHAAGCALCMSVLLVMCWRKTLPPGLRAAVAVALLFGFGIWLLLQGSAVGPLYLLACPVMTALGLGLRSAVLALSASSGSLVAVGWWFRIPMPTAANGAEWSLAQWLNIGANHAVLGLLLTASCAFLLRRLEAALADQRQAAASMLRSEATLREVTAQVPGMVYRIRFGPEVPPHFLYTSPGSRRLFGLDPQAIVDAGTDIWRCVHPDDRDALQATLTAALAGNLQQPVEVRLRDGDGQDRWVQMQSAEVERHAGAVVHTGIMTDITQRKATEELVWQQAHLDALTWLPNRHMLHQQAHKAMADSQRSGQPLALLMIDLDRFKDINDALGHAFGDQLLAHAAERLRQCVRDGDTVARMGGDEFTLLLPGLDVVADADAIAQRVLAAMASIFSLEGKQVHLTASVGIALYPTDAGDLDSLLRHADQAMYVAKDAGRNRMSRFTPELQQRAQLRMRLATDLRSALARRQLRVVYQPIVDLATGRVRKAEALLRWQHPEFGAISPAQFIPIAEAIGLIGEIGDWVFRTAALQAQTWRSNLDPSFQISVNRSPLQFRSDQAPCQPWPEVLAAMGLPGDAIAVEITEGLLLDSGDAVAGQLRALRDAGLQVSLDDFGTGYSALAYLHRFDIDVLKIDRSFVSGLSAGETGRTLCRAIVLMAHELGLEVLAEGVETAEQLDWLRAAGCDHGQGYLFSGPMAPSALEIWLAQRHQLAPA